MPNFFCEDAYMDSTRYYEEEHSWVEQCYGGSQDYMPYQYEEPPPYPQYYTPNHYEDSLSMPHYEEPYYYEEQHSMNQWECHYQYEESPRTPQVDMDYDHCEEFQANAMLLRILEEQKRIDAQYALIFTHLDEIEESQKRIAMHLASSMNDEEEEMLEEEHDISSHPPTSDLCVLLDGQIEFEDVEPPQEQGHSDFVEKSMDQSPKQHCQEIDISSKDSFGPWAPEHINDKSEKRVPIKLMVDVEDPFFIISPQDKFESFEPYISRPIERSSHNPSNLKETICKKGLNLQRKVHSRLDGRRVKWDLKVD